MRPDHTRPDHTLGLITLGLTTLGLTTLGLTTLGLTTLGLITLGLCCCSMQEVSEDTPEDLFGITPAAMIGKSISGYVDAFRVSQQQ